MKNIIERLVNEEARNILSESEEAIREIVKSSLLPELRSAIRESIAGEIKKILADVPAVEKTDSSFGNTHANKDDRMHDKNIKPPSSPDHRALDAEPRTTDNGETTGRYLYCVVEGNGITGLGGIGIDGKEVYAVSYKDLSVFVHDCPAEPYRSEDEETIKGWIVTHQDVVDAVWKKFGFILPMGFDTIIKGDEIAGPDENVKKWLLENYENLKAKLDKVRGKAEYGVQIFWNPETMAQKIIKENAEMSKLNEEIKSKPKGTAYMYRQKLEDLLKKQMESEADKYFKKFYDEIKLSADDLKVEKTKKTDDENTQMLMNLSCLMSHDGSRKLGSKLDKIDSLEGFSVRYTGPWPAYSFV